MDASIQPKLRVVLATVGTRGDVQPMLALAQALRHRGHDALLACPESFAAQVTGFGVAHAALGEDLQALMEEKGGQLQRSLAGMKRYFTEQLCAQAPRLLELARDAHVVVGTAMAWSAASVAEKLGIPALTLFPTSCAPSRLHPPPLLPLYGLPQWMNALLWRLNDSVQDRLMGQPLNAARDVLGLPALPSFTRSLYLGTPAVIAADESFLPADPAWGDRYRYTGYLFADDPRPLDPALESYLAAGEPPVCVGFGSMAGAQPARMQRVLLEALGGSGRRCLVLSGAAKLFGDAALPKGWFAAREAPHAALFPRVACVVHHGGAGTVAAVLRAGVPQVVLPMMLDQFHHRHHLVRAGLAPHAPRLAKVDAGSLARALEQALALPVEPRQAMSARLQARHGGATLAEHLEGMLAARTAASGQVRR